MASISIHPNRVSITPPPRKSICDSLVASVSPLSEYHLKNSTWVQNFSIKSNPFILSAKSKRKLFDSINLLYSLSNKRNIKMRNGKHIYNFRAAFITLTLPSKQMHSDTFIKKNCLNQLFVELRNYYNLRNYVWKAELQENENIHFHIITDSYIDYQALRRRWNRILEKYGYLSAYSDKMNSLSFAQYHKLRNKYHACTIEKSSEAYHKGRSVSWRSPNSVDIKSIFSKKNLAAYLGKYVGKNVSKDLDPARNATDLNPKQLAFIHRQMSFGRSWFRSYSLSSIKRNIRFEFDSMGDLVSYLDSAKDKVLRVVGDFFTCFYFDLEQLDSYFKERILRAVRLNADFYGYSSA